MAMTSTQRPRRVPTLRLPRGRRPAGGDTVTPVPAAPLSEDAPPVEIAPHDPVLTYFQEHPEPIDLAGLKLDSPGVLALRDAGVKLVVPLVSQGELIGLLNLGARLSEQDYSADDRKLLESLAGQAAPALRVAQLVREQEVEVRRRERYEQELQVAQLIQQNFLPHRLPEPSGWSLDAFYRPAREVGGDFYDFIALPGGELGVVVGDVTDKGVPAALVMASTRSVLRSSASRLVEPAEVLQRVNDVLVEDMPPNMFVTCLYGVLSPDTGRFRFANAGHNLPSVQIVDGAFEPRATGLPLGLLPDADYDENEIVIGAGHSVVLYSDALPEAHAPDGEMFGFPRMLGVVGDRSRSGRLIDRLMTELDRFTGPSWEQEDDITIVTLRRSAHQPLTLDPLPPEEYATDDDPGEVLAEFTVRSELGNEREAIARLGRALTGAGGLGLSAARTAALETAVGEATMNAIEHGNLADAALLVEIRVWADEHAVVVRITDQAKGEPAAVEAIEPDIEAKLRGEQSPRGWGLFLIRNMVDDVRVCSSSDRHIVELVMRLEAGR
jgi:serine phosphatase RsbU (regulator of sigma subunit)/anti-sigma regulatory factor (Ser/Thr protein kinase)